MSENGKQVLTPEEVVARKGNAPADSEKALYREAEAVIRAAHHATSHMNSPQAPQNAPHDVVDATSCT